MTQSELYNVLKSTGLPVAYLEFRKTQNVPFIVYLESGRENISADDKVWHKHHNYRIELYTATKSPKDELLLENALDNAEIFYTTDEIGKIDSEDIYEVAYYVTL